LKTPRPHASERFFFPLVRCAYPFALPEVVGDHESDPGHVLGAVVGQLQGVDPVAVVATSEEGPDQNLRVVGRFGQCAFLQDTDPMKKRNEQFTGTFSTWNSYPTVISLKSQTSKSLEGE
jgi:hypothetical protein